VAVGVTKLRLESSVSLRLWINFFNIVKKTKPEVLLKNMLASHCAVVNFYFLHSLPFWNQGAVVMNIALSQFL